MILGPLLYTVISPEGFSQRLQTLTAIATGIGAFGLFMNLLFTSETVENSRRSLEQQQKGDADARFFEAAKLLGDASMDARIGALFALEQLAREPVSVHIYQQAIEVICAFIRRRSKAEWPDGLVHLSDDPDKRPKAPHDIEVAVNILARRKRGLGAGENGSLDLRNANLCGVYIQDGDLAGARLGGALLIDAHFLRGNLSWANLINADLRHAVLDRVLLVHATLIGIKGEEATLDYHQKLPDPWHLIPINVRDDDEQVWLRHWPESSRTWSGVAYLHRTTWSDMNFGGADVHLSGPPHPEPPFESDVLGLQHTLVIPEMERREQEVMERWKELKGRRRQGRSGT